jgi:hypothetical protein
MQIADTSKDPCALADDGAQRLRSRSSTGTGYVGSVSLVKMLYVGILRQLLMPDYSEHLVGSRFSNSRRSPGGRRTMSVRTPKALDSDEHATLYRVMQSTIAQGLQASYQVPKELPHQLLVLLMQINERKRRK